MTEPSPFRQDICRFCGRHVGWGHVDFHIRVCDDPYCQELAKREPLIDDLARRLIGDDDVA